MHWRRHRRGLVAVLVAALGVTAAPNAIAATPDQCDFAGVVHHALAAVVNISVVRVLRAEHAPRGKPPSEHFEVFVGSGVIVDPSGVIVTNKHVIEDAAVIRVTFQDRTQVLAHLIRAAGIMDLAVLKVDVPDPLPTVSFGNSDALQVGQEVIAVGNPLGIGTSVSTGVISGVNRNLMRTPFDDFIQTDASINPGNSGGPLLDCSGKVVGIDTALLSNSTLLGSIGLGFALPSNDVSFVSSLLRSPERTVPSWIGVHLQDVTADIATVFNRPWAGGAVVAGVDPDSPAARAGLRPGQIITGIDGHPLLDARAALRDVAMSNPGQTMMLTVWQDGHSHDASVQPQDWPNMRALRQDVLATPADIERAEAIGLGLRVADITAADRKRYGLANAKGVLVTYVTPQSQAQNVGLQVGDVIEQVDEKPANSAAGVTLLFHPPMAAAGKLMGLLVRGKVEPKWFTVWVGRIPASDMVAGAGQSQGASKAQNVSSPAR